MRTDVMNDPAAAISFVEVRFSRPGFMAPAAHVDLMKKARMPAFMLSADTRLLLEGQETQLHAPTPASGLRFSSVLPEVATVDAAGRVTARGPGVTTIVASTLADTTSIGWIEVTVRR